MRFANEHGARDPGSYVERYKAIALRSVDAFVIGDPTVDDVLAALHERNIPAAILTNGWAPLQQRKAAVVKFDGPVLVSEELGVQKPEPRAFQALAKALDVAPAEVAFVGDTPASDVQGAIAAGMQGVWLDAEGVSYPADGPRPTFVIHALTDILKFL
jgi:putative hydrolase of the HAD superfamily